MWTTIARTQYWVRRPWSTNDLPAVERSVIAPLLPANSTHRPVCGQATGEIVNAVLYVLRNSVPWRLLPRYFPPHQIV